jgi:hypothetical protein
MPVEFSNSPFHYYLRNFSSAKLGQDTGENIAMVTHVQFLLCFLPTIRVNVVNKMPRLVSH